MLQYHFCLLNYIKINNQENKHKNKVWFDDK